MEYPRGTPRSRPRNIRVAPRGAALGISARHPAVRVAPAAGLRLGASPDKTNAPPSQVLVHGAGVVAGALACCVCDPYAVVVGASGGAYALMGAHVGAIFKDWDRLKHGVLDRNARLGIFLLLLCAGRAESTQVGPAIGHGRCRGHGRRCGGSDPKSSADESLLRGANGGSDPKSSADESLLRGANAAKTTKNVRSPP